MTDDCREEYDAMLKEFDRFTEGRPLSLGVVPVYQSNFLPEAKEVTERVEWLTRRPNGSLDIRHELRSRGSVYETRKVERKVFIFASDAGMGQAVVMHPEDYSVLKNTVS